MTKESEEAELEAKEEAGAEAQAKFDAEKPDKRKKLLYEYKTRSITTTCSGGRGRMARKHPLWKEVWNVNRNKYRKATSSGGKQECARRKKQVDEGKIKYVQHWDYVDFKRVRPAHADG